MNGRNIAQLLFGSRLATKEEQEERIGGFSALPNLGLDALSSAAYGPEAALTILLPAGAAGIRALGPLTLAIVVLMGIVCLSYRQTIAAYPNGGGSYIVAKENLGEQLGLVAASALMLDYVLNVAVGISAGVGAVISAIPSLEPHTLSLCLVLLAVLTLVNLRGVREAGLVFLLPTYAFIGCLGATMIAGVAKAIASGGHPSPATAVRELPHATATLSIVLLLRAFASGCTALTGVEAVSNAVPIFRAPTTRRAQRTLVGIVAILALLLAGCAVLCRAYHIGATEPGRAGYESVLSQLVGAVAGRGVFYAVTMGSIFCVLSLSANTSFMDFPRVCHLLAVDRYLPPEYAHRGRRLVFSAGILALAACAAVLLIVFRGVTDRLIPLFAIGAFLAFTFSQAGMVRHWQKHPGSHRRKSLVLNATGAVATGITALVVVTSKFLEGAWISVLLVGGLVLLFRRIHAYYREVERETDCASTPLVTLDLPAKKAPIVIVPVKDWNFVVQRALRFSVKLSSDVRAVQVVGADIDAGDLRRRWRALVETPLRRVGIDPPRLDIVPSDDRRLFAPLLDYVFRVRDENPDRDITVVVPEKVERRWYHTLLLTHHASVLKTLLLLEGGKRVVVVSAPWYLRE
ncbi:MAG TPA: APC family permease [Polyangiaceae bacterium]|nr:APC family permease [Polyangiaceae bacterium]